MHVVLSAAIMWRFGLVMLGVRVALADSGSVFADLLKLRSHHAAVVLSCGPRSDCIPMVTKLLKAGIFVAYYDLDSRDEIESYFSNQHRSGVYIDLDCESAKELITNSTIELTAVYSWVGVTRDAAAAAAALRPAPLTLASDLIMLEPDGDLWLAYDVYRVDFRKQSPLNITFYGYYFDSSVSIEQTTRPVDLGISPSLILYQDVIYRQDDIKDMYEKLRSKVMLYRDMHLRHFFALNNWRLQTVATRMRRRWDMHHSVDVKCVYVITQKPPRTSAAAYMRSGAAPHLDSPPRYNLALLRHMQGMMRFNITLRRIELWGIQSNGSWVGAVAALQRRRADVVFAVLMKRNRLGVIDYSGHIATTSYPTLFLQPSSARRPSLRAFAAPLAGGCWAAALALAAADAALLAVTAVLEIKYLRVTTNRVNVGTLLTDLVNVVYLDGVWPDSKLWGGRWAALFGGFLGLMLMQFYSASLLAAVLAPPPHPINSLQDLIRSDLVYKVEDIAYHRQFFAENMDNPDIARLYQTKILKGPLPPFISLEQGIDLVAEGNFAFQCTSSYSYHAMSSWPARLVCALGALDVYPPVQHHLAVTSGSPYRQPLLVMTALMRERGVLTHTAARYYPRAPRCPPERAAAPRPVTLPQTAPVLLLLAELGCVSVLILFTELAVQWGLQRSRGARTYRE